MDGSAAAARAVSVSRSRQPSRVRVPTASFKRLIVTADGTWLNSDNGLVNGQLSIPSNVTRISRAIKEISSDGIPQIVYYHFGVGSRGGAVDRFVQGATGEGLEENVREAYSFLANNYTPGDEIFLLGFSRGAFTVRSIAGIVDNIGLLTKAGLEYLPEIHKDLMHQRDPNYRPKHPDQPFPRKMPASDPRYASELERRGLTRRDIRVKAIGVWDTVGSLGTPRIGFLQRLGVQSPQSRETSFYDTTLSDCVENAFQALALDERRSAFSPAVWEKPPGNNTVLRQVWFPGAHSNVGGGYDDQQIANITLAWMMAQLEPFLDMNTNYLLNQDDDNYDYYLDVEGLKDPRPWSFGKIVNSMKGLYALGGRSIRTPGRYMGVNPHTHRPTDRPLRATHEYIHPSCRSRLYYMSGGPGVEDKGIYDCPAMQDWKLVVDYTSGPGLQGPEGEPNIFWKLRRERDNRKNLTTRVLPEAPLWGIERKLCQRDPSVYDYITAPPPTSNKSRSSGKRRRADSHRASGAIRPGSSPGPAPMAPLPPTMRGMDDPLIPFDEKRRDKHGRRRSYGGRSSKRSSGIRDYERDSWEDWESSPPRTRVSTKVSRRPRSGSGIGSKVASKLGMSGPE